MKPRSSVDIAAVLYFLLCTVAVPLAVHNNYFDIVETKRMAYQYGSGVIALLTSLLFVIRKEKLKIRLHTTEKLLIAFCIAALLSSYFSSSFKESFIGSDGWGIGTLTFILATEAIILFSNSHFDFDKWAGLFYGVNIVLLGLMILNSAAIDPLKMHEGMLQEQVMSYVSTLGNINWLVGYLCLLLPLSFERFLKGEKKRALQWLNLMALITEIVCVILCASDGIFLGMGVYIACLLPEIIHNDEDMKKAGFVIVVFALALLMIRYLAVFNWKYSEMSGLFKMLFKGYVPLFLLTLGVVTILLFHRGEKVSYGVRKAILCVTEAGIVACALYFVYGLIKAYRAYDYSWGNNRLAIWHESFYLYRVHFLPQHKLFGIGVEMLRGWYDPLSKSLKTVIRSAHSEPVQVFMSMGIAGFTLYSLICADILLKYLRKDGRRAACRGYYLALFAYFAQSLVNSAIALNFALETVVIALLLKELKKDEEEI